MMWVREKELKKLRDNFVAIQKIYLSILNRVKDNFQL